MNISCYINGTSYGLIGSNLIPNLIKQGTDVALFPLSDRVIVDHLRHDYIKYIQQAIHNQDFYDKNAAHLLICHEFMLAQNIGKGKQLAYTIFELDDFDPRRLHHMSNVDNLLVPTKWAQDICIAKGIKSEILNLGIDTDIFVPDESKTNKDGPTIFFTCGKWEKRKGHDILPIIFEKAFDINDNVLLYCMTDNPFPQAKSDEWRKLYSKSKLASKIKFISRVKTHNQVVDILQRIDIGVFPFRAEGWLFGLIELMACGKFSIVTNYSGPTEYAKSDNCHLINITNKELAEDGIWFKTGVGNWAHLDDKYIDNFAEAMRELHKKKQKGENLFNQKGVETAQKYSWKNIGKKLIEYVKS